MISRLHRLLPALLAVDALLLALGVGSFIVARHDGVLSPSHPRSTPRSLASRLHPATATPAPSATPVPATATPRPTLAPATPAPTSTLVAAPREGRQTVVRTVTRLTGTRARHFHHGPPRVRDWNNYDTAVFVASTLNLPRCSGGEPLSAVLAQDGARAFVVLRSPHRPSLYFIQVRTASRALLAVYAYQLGWKYPQGVEGGQCVRAAASPISADYRQATVVLAGRFDALAPA